MTNFQKDLYFKEHPWKWRFSILFSILQIIVSLISYSYIWSETWKSDNILAEMSYINSNPIFLVQVT